MSDAVLETLHGAHQTVSLSALLDGLVVSLHEELRQTLPRAAAGDDATRFAKSFDADDPSFPACLHARRQELLSYVHSARQQLLRLYQLLQWSQKARVVGELVGSDKLRAKARQHAMDLRDAADGMAHAHAYLRASCMPLFDVPTALEVLTTGTYSDLPSSIESLRPTELPAPAVQKAKLQHVNHLLYSHLLKVRWPPPLRVVSVAGGCAVLRCAGLYHVKLTLVPAPEPPPEVTAAVALAVEAESATWEREAAGACTAMEVGPSRAAREPDGSGRAAVGAPAPSTSAYGGDGSAEAESRAQGPKQQRWVWRLLDFVLLVNLAAGPPLHGPQVEQLLVILNDRMGRAAALAHFNKQVQIAAEQIRGSTAGGAGAAAAAPVPGGMDASASAVLPLPLAVPAASGVPDASAMPAASGVSMAASDAVAAQKLAHVESFSADDMTYPIQHMHHILCDIAARVLLDAVNDTAGRLLGPGGRWSGHATSAPIRNGLRISLWRQAAHLTDAPALGPARPAGGPVLEFSIGPEGGVDVMFCAAGAGRAGGAALLRAAAAGSLSGPPSLSRAPPSLAAAGLVVQAAQTEAAEPGPTSAAAQLVSLPEGAALDASLVNVEELMLQAASGAAALQLASMQMRMAPALLRFNLLPPPRLQLTRSAKLWTAAVPVGRAAAGGQDSTVSKWRDIECSGDGVAGAGGLGDAEASSPPATVGRTIEVPVLEFWGGKALMLKVSFSLFTGRLVLQSGPGLAHISQIEHLASISQDEERLNQIALRAYHGKASDPNAAPPVAGGASTCTDPGQRALQDVCTALVNILRKLYHEMHYHACIGAARRLSLNVTNLMQPLLKAYVQAHPGCPDVHRHSALLAFEPRPFPRNFPHTEPRQSTVPVPEGQPSQGPQTAHSCGGSSAAGTSGASAEDTSSSLTAVSGLMFCIGVDMPLTPSGTYSLIVCSTNVRGMTTKILKCIPVPRRIYQPDSGGGAFTLAAPQLSSVPGLHQQTAPVASGLAVNEPELGKASTHSHTQERQQQGQQQKQAANAVTGDGSHQQSGSSGGALAMLLNGTMESVPGSSGGAGLTAVVAPPPNTAACSTAAAATPFGGATPRPAAVRHVAKELQSMMSWCRRRILRETLIYQLTVLGVHFREIGGGGNGSLVMKNVGGSPLPARIARRQDLAPRHVGVTSAIIELGHDDIRGEFSGRLRGTFFHEHCRDHPCAMGFSECMLALQQRLAATPVLFGTWVISTPPGAKWMRRPLVGQLLGPLQCRSHRHGSRSVVGGATCLPPLRAYASQLQPGQQLVLRYSLSQSSSALDFVLDLLSILRLQTFLARIEMLAAASPASPAQQQHSVQGASVLGSTLGLKGCVGGPAPTHATLPALAVVACQGSQRATRHVPATARAAKQHLPSCQGGPPGVSVGEDDRPEPKRIKLKAAGALPNGGLNPSTRSWQLAVLPQQDEQRRLMLKEETSVEKVDWGTQREGGAAGALPDVEDAQHRGTDGGSSSKGTLAWRWGPHGSLEVGQYTCTSVVLRLAPPARRDWSGRSPLKHEAGAAGTAEPPPITLHICWESHAPGGLQTHMDGTSAMSGARIGAALASAVGCRIRCHGVFPAPTLTALQELADCGDEGLLLDALLITAWPQWQLAAALQRLPAGTVTLVPSRPPYQQRLVCRALSGWMAAVDVAFMAVGRSWLRVALLPHRCFEAGPVAAGRPASGMMVDTEALTASLTAARLSLAGLRGGAVHFSEAKGQGELWALVDNAILADAVAGLVLNLHAP